MYAAWAWFLNGGWILAAGGVVVVGLVAAAVVVGATARQRGRHVLGEYVEPYGFIGSMNLDDEREFLTTVPGTRMTIWAPSGEVEFSEEPGWREQTAADLSPEALAHAPWDGPWPSDDREPGDSGPGVDSSLGSAPAPGPDLMWADRSAERFDSVTDGPGSDHPLMLSGGGGPGPSTLACDLGPRAAWVLGCYERRHREKWAWVEPARVDFAAVMA